MDNKLKDYKLNFLSQLKFVILFYRTRSRTGEFLRDTTEVLKRTEYENKKGPGCNYNRTNKNGPGFKKNGTNMDLVAIITEQTNMDLVAIITEQKWTWLPKRMEQKNGPSCQKNGTKMDLVAKRMEQKWTWLQKNA